MMNVLVLRRDIMGGSNNCVKNGVRFKILLVLFTFLLVQKSSRAEEMDLDQPTPGPESSGFDLSQVLFDEVMSEPVIDLSDIDMDMLADLNLEESLENMNMTRTGKSDSGIAAAALLLSAAAAAQAQNTRDFRLPSSIAPINYRLFTRPIIDETERFQQFTSPSKIWIAVNVLNSTNEIILHSKNLTINEEMTMVTDANRKTVVPIVDQSFDIINDFFIIHLNESLEVGGTYEIFIDFVAPVYKNRRDGIYLTEYKDPADSTKINRLVSTLFAPTQARRAFPCFDEPQMKATFTINIGRPSNYKSLSNMPLLGSSQIANLDGWWSDHYDNSVPMSTYLVAFVISNFSNHSISSVDVFGGRPVQSWGDSSHVQKNGLSYASNFTSSLVPFFEEFLGFNYTIPKIDSVAMPKISYAGMESYGLIIYMESSLLYFPGKSTEEQRRRTSALICHEIAHQWFGNLISFSWWSDIYLSEGFSTYIQYVGLEKLAPEFQPWTNFVSDVFQTALTADSSSLTSHPIHQPIEKNLEIFLIYDKIAYDKGASLIRCMEHFLTTPVFNSALRNYVKKHAFKAIHQDQFFETFDEVAHEAGVLPKNMTIKMIMDTWTKQSGYPIVKVTGITNQSTIIIEQEQYDPEGLGLNGTWYIPLTINVESSPNFNNTFPTLWMSPTESLTSINISRKEDDWLMINAASTGFYRVLYDTNLTESIQRQLYLDHTVFPASARCRIIDDYLTVAFKRFTPVETALNMISYIGKETDYTVWKTVFSHLKYISEMLSAEDVHFSKWLSMKMNNVFLLLDQEASPEQQEATPGVVALRRHFLITWACYFKVSRCVGYASELVMKWKANPEINPIPRAIKSTVYCSIAAGEDAELSDFLLDRLKQEKDTEEQNLLLEGLSCNRNMNMIQNKLTRMGEVLLDSRTEATSATEEEKRLKMILRGVIKTSTEGRKLTWKFVQALAMEAAEEKKLSRFSMLGEVVLMLGSYWNTPNDKIDLENFINTVGTKLDGNNLSPTVASLMARSLQASLERVDKNIVWMESFYSRVQSWFALENYYFPEGFLIN